MWQMTLELKNISAEVSKAVFSLSLSLRQPRVPKGAPSTGFDSEFPWVSRQKLPISSP